MSPIISEAGEASLQALMEGHTRFRNGEQQPRGMVGGAQWRRDNETQRPLAVILTCADARISPDTLFDQTPGALFEVRVAGPVASPEVLGSIEFAVGPLSVPLVLVLGHARCGAVQAAWTRARRLKAEPESEEASPLSAHLLALVDQVIVAPEDLKAEEAATLQVSEEANARAVARNLAARSALLNEALGRGALRIAAAHYDLDLGQVTLLGGSQV